MSTAVFSIKGTSVPFLATTEWGYNEFPDSVTTWGKGVRINGAKGKARVVSAVPIALHNKRITGVQVGAPAIEPYFDKGWWVMGVGADGQEVRLDDEGRFVPANSRGGWELDLLELSRFGSSLGPSGWINLRNSQYLDDARTQRDIGQMNGFDAGAFDRYTIEAELRPNEIVARVHGFGTQQSDVPRQILLQTVIFNAPVPEFGILKIGAFLIGTKPRIARVADRGPQFADVESITILDLMPKVIN